MNTENELFGELHEQEENGLFGNEHKRQYEAQQEALCLSAVNGSVSFPKGRPKCCGQEMYPFGGVIGKRPDGKVGDVEHFWRCDVCNSEVVDLLS